MKDLLKELKKTRKRKLLKLICTQCSEKFHPFNFSPLSRRFCSLSCSAIYNSQHRELSVNKKISETLKRKGIHPPKQVGYHHSNSTKKKISDGNKGKVLSLETRQKIRNANLGKISKLKGVKRPDEVREKISESKLGKANLGNRGEKSHLWRGGVTPINLAIRVSLEYKIWRRSVFERDKWTCVWCGKTGGRINADHIKSFAHYPELRFAIDNGRTLCVPCHRKTDTYGGNSRY